MKSPYQDIIIPEKLIAQEGIEPRDAARLLVVDTRNNKLYTAFVRDLPNILPADTLMVVNNTRVIPSRIALKDVQGVSWEATVMVNEIADILQPIPVLIKEHREVGEIFIDPVGKEWVVTGYNDMPCMMQTPYTDVEEFKSMLQTYGTMPLPKYIHTEEGKVGERYQTVFGKESMSAAAPTAALHFTPSLFEALEEKGIEKVEVTLHVGLGTFAPVGDETIQKGTLHQEPYSVSEDVWKKIVEKKGKVLAVGTTSVRTLESVSATGNLSGNTNIFIRPGYSFTATDMLLTNFHVNMSSLMYLVDAFLQHKKSTWSIRDIYEYAVKENFRFFSLGDSMLVL